MEVIVLLKKIYCADVMHKIIVNLQKFFECLPQNIDSACCYRHVIPSLMGLMLYIITMYELRMLRN